MTLTRRQVGLLVALTLMWGLNWPVMKFTLRAVEPLTFRALTMGGGVLVLALWLRWRGTLEALPRGALGPVALLALPNIVGWHLGSIIGLTQLGAGRAAILAFTMPVWTMLLGALWFAQPLGRRAWAASACALAAVALLAAQELTSLAGRPLGVLWLQGAAASWALGTLMMRRLPVALGSEALTMWMMALGTVVFATLALAFEPAPQPAAWNAGTWIALAWGIVVNFGIAQMLWFGLARELPPQASTFSLMAVPLVGVVSSALALGDTPRWTDWVAALCIAAAIASATGLLGRRGDNARQ
jgi:drug/metabolite transporter (DMT)-like permease